MLLQEDLYDPIAKTGYIERYIRERRSRSNEIATLWTHKKKRCGKITCFNTKSQS